MIKTLLIIMTISMMLGITTIIEPQTTAFAEKYNKENCEDNNGEWIDGECDFYENQMKEGWEVDEDNFYKEVCEEEEKESDECKKHRLSIEDGE
jgi:hypothetical protein